MIRPPAVAGRFYPEEPDRLRELVNSMLANSSPGKSVDAKTPARACMLPHAGYKYSGAVAAEVFRRMEIPSRVILIGPQGGDPAVGDRGDQPARRLTDPTERTDVARARHRRVAGAR